MASRAFLSFSSFLSFVLLAIGIALPAQAKDEWPPISAEDLAMKEYPASPGAPAIVLYRERHTDDKKSFATHYYRIKIFTDEGRKYANVEIPYFEGTFRVKDIKARTVHPDGAIITFTGGIFEKLIVKHKKLKLLAKTFSLPNVRMGTIIEYKYTIRWGSRVLLPTDWDIEHELFTRRAHFSLRPNRSSSLRPNRSSLPYSHTWTSLNVSKDITPDLRDGTYQMKLRNIPAFLEEKHMPPEGELKMRIRFYYQRPTPMSFQGISISFLGSATFWQQKGKELHREVEKFIGKRKAIAKEAARIVQPNDPPGAKLRKLYARVHQIRNLSYDRKNAERDKKLKKNKNVGDVLKRGYGRPWHINWLFVALARAAGFDATAVRVASRMNGFFKPKLLDDSQLDSDLALVRHGGKEYYLDPATRFCPFGLLSWDQTGVQGIRPSPGEGIRLGKDGEGFVKTPTPMGVHAHTGRKAVLHLGEDGSLHGKVELTFTGQEALQRRLDAIEKDEAGARKELEDKVKGWLPAGATVDQQNVTGWEGTEEPLKAEFAVRIPTFGTSTGRRLILPLAIFQANEKHPLPHAKRVHPVYFPYPWQEVDEITVQLPEGYQVESLPKKWTSTPQFGRYEISYENQERTLRLQRRFVLNGYYFPVKDYPNLRLFFDAVRKGDEQQVVLQVAAASQQN